MRRIARSAVLAHSAPQMYALVADIESYPRFLPWCLAARVEERAPERVRATLSIGLRGVRTSFTTQNDNRPGEAIDMRLVRGPFRAFAAAWRFTPLSAQSCRIEFTVEYAFAGGLLARMMEPLFDGIADSMVDAFSRRAEEVYRDA